MNLNEIQEKLLENSINSKSLNETNSADLENYDQLIGNIIKDTIRTHIGYDICDVQVLKGPQGKVFARASRLDKFEILSKNVITEAEKTDVEISPEALDDLVALTSSSNLFTDFVVSSTKRKSGLKLIKFLTDNAEVVGNLTLTGESLDNNETNLFYINKKVNDEIGKMNKQNFRTYDAFCILPYNQVGGILGLSFTYSKIADQANDHDRATGYFLGKINNVRYYINPDENATDVIVGLNSKVETGNSAVIFSPYNIIINSAISPENGHKTYHVWVRNGYTLSPLHTTANPMLVKFKIV